MISRFTKVITFFVTITQSMGIFAQSIQQQNVNIPNNIEKIALKSLSSLPSIRLWDWWFKQKDVKRSLMVQPQQEMKNEPIVNTPISSINSTDVSPVTEVKLDNIKIEKAADISSNIEPKNQTVVDMPVTMMNYSSVITPEQKLTDKKEENKQEKEIKVNKPVQKGNVRVVYESMDLLPEETGLYKRVVMRSGDKLSNSLREFLLENEFELSWQVENGNGKARDYQLLERAVFVASNLNQVLEKVIEPFGLYAKIYEQEKIVVISNENNNITSIINK